MRYFTVYDENASYFYRPNTGICRKYGFSGAEPEVIMPGALDGFGLCRDESTHIICADEKSEIYYIKQGKEPVRILAGRDGVRPYDFVINSWGSLPHLFYKAQHEGEILLFHYVAGTSAGPKVISSLSPEHTEYATGDRKVFFTSKDNVLGYCDFKDSRTGDFVSLCRGGYMPYFAELAGDKYLVYVCDGSIMVNGNPVCRDEYALSPVLYLCRDKLILQWRSGSFIKYMTCKDIIHWSKPMRYMGNGAEPEIITYAGRMGAFSCYGCKGRPFTAVSEKEEFFISSELKEIKKQVDILKQELKKINSVNYFNQNDGK